MSKLGNEPEFKELIEILKGLSVDRKEAFEKYLEKKIEEENKKLK